jgi:16S rRNA (guanine966-N2)-methyltransferase
MIGRMTAANRVRIIGGKWRSRILRFPPAAELRPTPDRVRETLFNWLGQRLDGLTCLDLFAGSGALGFEAMSRGAARVVMVERDRAVASALKDSAKLLDAGSLEVVQGDALAYLKRAAETFDVVFVDPPYASDLAMKALELLPVHLEDGARVYVESATPLSPPPGWTALREDRAGAVRYALFEHASE